jgi:HAD superfamily hydrolase (TIGR01484 family)
MQYANKQIIVFDLDGTLASSKSALSSSMASVLFKLLELKKIAVISGGNMEQLTLQFLAGMPRATHFENLYLLPTSGSSMHEYKDGSWQKVYNESFSEEERDKIKSAFMKVLENDERPVKIFGERIEDRGSQVTYSALGQHAPLELKQDWDPDQGKRKLMVVKLQEIIPEFSISIGGTTSIDVTKKGIDKAYGIRKLEEILHIPIADMLFVGDKLFPGGNDWSAKSTGIDCEEVSGPDQTEQLILSILN